MPGAEREAASRRAGGWQGPRGRWQRSDPAGTQDGYGARGRSGPGPGLGAQHPSARASQSQRAWGRGGGASAPLKAERVSSDTSSMLPKRRNCTFHALGRAASPSRRLRRLRTSLPLLLPCDLALAQGARQGRGPHLTSQARTQRLGAPRWASTHPVC